MKIHQTEDINTEFKTSFSDEVIISLVAFSNAKGGTVFVGVGDNKEVKGVTLGKETLAGWLNEIKNKTLPSVIPNVDEIKENGKTVIAFSVAEYPVKPISMKGRYYQRRANANHILSAVEIANLSLQSRNLSWDSYPYEGASFDDLDINKINRFILKVNEVGRFTLSSEPQQALEKLNMLQDGVPTNAAMILFSKKDLRYNVHIGRFKTPSMIIADKMISGNLYDVVEESMQTIIGHLKFAFEINIKDANTQRTEIPEYPLDAIRELLLNALIHRDYLSPTDVQIKIFDNSISFFNPSGLYGNITEEDLSTDAYRASTRNKQIAEAFYLTKDIEKYGSGFTRVRREIAAYPSMKFQYRNAGYGFFAEFNYERQKISLEEKSSDNVTDNVTDNVDRMDKIVKLLDKKPNISTNELAIELSVTKRTILRDIAKLKEKQKIQRLGKVKSGYWIVKKDHE